MKTVVQLQVTIAAGMVLLVLMTPQSFPGHQYFGSITARQIHTSLVTLEDGTDSLLSWREKEE